MDWLSIALISVGLSADAFAVSVSCGLCAPEKMNTNALKAGISFGIFQWGMLSLGWLAGSALHVYIESIDHWIAFVLLGFVGGKMIFEAFKNEGKSLALTNLRLLLVLSVATSIDALAAGISISALDYPIMLPAILVGSTTFTLSFLGVRLGCWLYRFRRLGSWIDLAGGLILIGISLKILLEHLLS